MSHYRCLFAAGLVCLLAACTSEPERARAIGEAFVGPAALSLKEELTQRSEVVAELKHGEKLEILAVRRRFLRVRTAAGKEGWLDGRNLLAESQMRNLERTIAEARTLPSQGKATVYEPLNIHSEPHRQSPSPFQIPANGMVDVLAHAVAPRVPYQSMLPVLVNPPKPAAKKAKRKGKKKGGEPEQAEAKDEDLPPPPMPAAPKLPENWEDLSRSELAEGRESIRRDDWTLVRTPEGKAGWVLTRMITMALPDEVAQYANGKRISAYFPLATVDDEGQKKSHWLMATLSEPLQQHDFDTFRVFIYNLRKRRYETAFSGREVKGYYPVTTAPVEYTENRRTVTTSGFRILTEDAAGNRTERTYALYGYRVYKVKEMSVEKKPARVEDATRLQTAAPASPAETAEVASKGLFRRIREWFR